LLKKLDNITGMPKLVILLILNKLDKDIVRLN